MKQVLIIGGGLGGLCCGIRLLAKVNSFLPSFDLIYSA